eukprot:TRINITY_DN5650_c0_g1_i2.p1 TRINITY_DN5650_c0_g1~~TRINITY_DN5650_c0_g1_i2.p1  ORF type:complete len:132 (+),score=15.83 TRINITY_DN5650_c0_g1_i2:82-477(+)
MIIDDEIMVTGSTNMDNISFFSSSELSISIFSRDICRETRIRLFKEHLGDDYTPELDDNFDLAAQAFLQVNLLLPNATVRNLKYRISTQSEHFNFKNSASIPYRELQLCLVKIIREPTHPFDEAMDGPRFY